MAGKVLILRWAGSAYDMLGGVLEFTGQELTNEGFQVEVFPVDGVNRPDQFLERLNQGGYAFALTMSGIATDIFMQDRRLLWDAAQVPLFNWNCDHPCYFQTRHVIRSRFLRHGYVFPDHARYNLRHFNPNGSAFAVHIGMPARNVFAGAPLPFARRNGRIMFSKSGRDTNPIEASWRTRAPIVRDILFEAAEALFHRSTADFVPALQQAGERRGLMLDGNSELTLTLIREIDAYIRFKRANLLARTILRYPVDVYGTGWEHIPWDGATAQFLGAGEWSSLMQQLPNYLGCLSINPLVDESVHDRVFFALAAGVVPCSDSNTFSRIHAPALEPYNFAFAREWIEVSIDALLSDPREALDRTEATYQALSAEFTLRRAAQQIAQFSLLRWGGARAAY